MKRKVITVFSALAFCVGSAYSQGMIDAYRYVQTETGGTARFLGMGGAFGALGGDISVLNLNPAGLAVYRSSEVVTTLSVNAAKANANWFGTTAEENKTKVNFDNIAYVGYFPTSRDEGLVSWNVGFSYNRLKNFTRNYTAHSIGGMDYSLSDYAAACANSVPEWTGDDLWETSDYDPYANPDVGDWMSIVAMNSGMIGYDRGQDVFGSQFVSNNGQGGYTPTAIDETVLNVSESGAIDQYTIAFGANISDYLLLGASVGITDLNYNYISYYNEYFADGSTLTLGTPDGGNGLSTDGTGYNFTLGAIVNPFSFLRFGVAYNSPTWYKMTDYYYVEGRTSMPEGTMTAHTPSNAYTKYEYRTPDKWTFSAAAIIGQTALISLDYELMNYRRARMYDYYGSANIYTNTDIETFFRNANTIRVGAEVKVTPQFSVRAGYSWTSSGMNNDLQDNNVSVATVGTIPNYTIDRGLSSYSIGIGYRFTPHFYVDLAYVLRNQKDDVYAFAPLFDEEGIPVVDSWGAEMKTKTTRVALTLGYKF